MIGKTLAHYEITGSLGQGGMGEVYRAKDTKLGREVAIKVLPTSVANDADRLGRFEREARAVSALNHPNLVTLFELGTHEGAPYMVMELIEGETLRAKLGAAASSSQMSSSTASGPDTGMSGTTTARDSGTGLPVRRSLDVAIQIAKGLAAAHEKGIIHRDLKPDNVVITPDGRVKILDFGLAKLTQPDDESMTMAHTRVDETEPGKVMGTVGYMAPEQVRGGEVDHRGDIFALGVILYEMLSGRRAFVAPTSVETMNAILNEDPPTMSTGPRLSPAVERIVRRCLEKEPAQRFQSAHDLAYALDAMKDASGVTSTVEVQTAAPARRQPWLTFGAIALIAVVAGALLGRSMLTPSTGPASDAGNAAPVGRILPLTFEKGVERDPSLSPDGRSFVYRAIDGDDWDIFLQRVGGENRINLTEASTDEDGQPVFSPDGESIAFFSTRDDGGIFVMGATGESVRRLTDFGFNPAWAPDSKTIVFTTEFIENPTGRNTFSSLWTVDVTSGQSTKLYEGDAVEASWSPNGEFIAFWGLPPGTGKRVLYTMPAAGGTPQPLNDDDYFNWNPSWSADGSELYFASTRGGTMDLWHLPMDPTTGLATGPAQPITSSTEWVAQPSVSLDGSRIVYTSQRTTIAIGRIPFPQSGDTSDEALAIEPLIETSRFIWSARPSPDGKWLVLKATDPHEDLFVTAADGTGMRRLTQDSFKDRQPRFSPDSQTIYFFSDRTGRYEIWSIRPDGSGLTQISETTGENISSPVASPDGTKLAVISTDRGMGHFDLTQGLPVKEVIWSAPPDSGEMFFGGTWFPDGESVLGNATDGQPRRYFLADQTYEKLEAGIPYAQWVEPGRSYLRLADGSFSARDVHTGEDRELFRVSEDFEGDFFLSGDDQWLYMLDRRSEADIWMLEQASVD